LANVGLAIADRAESSSRREIKGMARDLTQAMWDKFVTALSETSAGRGLDPKTVMPTSGLTNADWEVMDITGLPSNSANPPAKGSTIVPALEAWANTMPEWSPNYVPSSRNFYDQYMAFLNSIQLKGGNAALQQIADGYATNLTNARTKLANDQTAMFTAWGTFNTGQGAIPEGSRITYDQWYQNNWASTILADNQAVQQQAGLFDQAMSNVGGPDFPTINRAKTRAQLAGGNSLTYNNLQYPAYTVTPGLNAFLVEGLQTLARNDPPQIRVEIDLRDDNAQANAQSSYLGVSARASYSSFFWGGSAAAAYSQSRGAQKYDGLVQGLKMVYTAQAARLFTFNLGPWYDSAMISGFANQISPNSALAGKSMTGEGGFLNLRTSQVLVVLKPSVTLTGSRNTIDALSNQFNQQSSASISVGALCWSASASASQGQRSFSDDVKISSDRTSITITDNTNAPKVILVVPSKPN
jgi:hypothetical protein